MKKSGKSYRAVAVNVLGRAGYFTVFVEWFLLVGLSMPRFSDSELGKAIFPKTAQKPVEMQPVQAVPLELSLFMTAIFLLLALTFVGLVVYVVFAKYIPGATKATTKAVHLATERTVPVLAHKPLEKIPPRTRKRLTARVQFWMKLGFAIVPLAIVYATCAPKDSVESQLLVFAFAVLCAASSTCFIAQTFISARN